jgi:hypothetical protein
MVGDAGKIVPAHVQTTLLVNSAAIRAHRTGDALTRLAMVVLPGWDAFMPVDVVHPIRDLDWVVLAGSLQLGSTRDDYYVGAYNVDESKADAITRELMTRARPTQKSKTWFVTNVDGGRRAYTRPQPGLLAIVPADERAATNERLRQIDAPHRVRPGELLRLATTPASFRVAGLPFSMPQGMKAARIWLREIDASNDLLLAAEGDCDDESSARIAADDLREQLKRSVPGLVRVAVRHLLDYATVWVDGKVVRYEARVPAALVEAAADIWTYDRPLPRLR